MQARGLYVSHRKPLGWTEAESSPGRGRETRPKRAGIRQALLTLHGFPHPLFLRAEPDQMGTLGRCRRHTSPLPHCSSARNQASGSNTGPRGFSSLHTRSVRHVQVPHRGPCPTFRAMPRIPEPSSGNLFPGNLSLPRAQEELGLRAGLAMSFMQPETK